jgi:hypothetical protein
VTSFLLRGRRGNPLFTILYIRGKTLGPVWSGQQRRVDDVSLLEGPAWYGHLGAFGAWWDKTEGAAGHVYAVALTFSWFQTVVSVWLLY